MQKKNRPGPSQLAEPFCPWTPIGYHAGQREGNGGALRHQYPGGRKGESDCRPRK